MKNLTFLIFTLLFTQIIAFSQSCLPEGIIFTTQSEIDSFQINYPYCTEIEGDVVIRNDDITNLNGLNVLTAFGGDLTIGGWNNQGTSLFNLSGLDNVTTIGGYLEFYHNNALTSLTGLDNVTSIGGYISIFSHNSLTSLSGLDNVTTIGGYLEFYHNNALTSLTGLDNLTSIEGDLLIVENDALTTISGLSNIISIGENIIIIFNDNLTSLMGLENLISIEGDLIIGGSNLLTSLTGLENLTIIGGGLGIYGHNLLTSLTGLENLTDIGGDLGIDGNCSLTSLSGLENLTSIGGNLNIGVDIYNGGTGNPSLTNLSGLNNLNSIGGDIRIVANDSLASLTGLENLTIIGGGLGIYGPNLLTSLSGLENLTSIGGNLNIGDIYYWGIDNPSLTNLSGLNNLNSIGGDIRIVANDSLASLTGLENVTSIGGDIFIDDNDALISITGLDNIDAESIDNLIITFNNSLSTCEVQSVCDYLAAPGGTIEIHDNAPGCNSPEEVEEACECSCLPEGILFTTQAQIDNFQTNYPNCTEIEGDVVIQDDDITNLNGLSVLTSFGGDLTIGGWYYQLGTSLVNLSGLENVTSIGDSLLIKENSLLTSLTGLDNLTSIGGYLEIYSNDDLTSLAGLSNVTTLGGDLVIRFNEVLTSLSGLDNIDTGSIINLSIYYNPALSTCEVQSICDYLVSPNGFVTIHNNTGGCDNPPEVANACGNTIPCLPYGPYYFLSQSDIDDFQTNYPGCTELEGQVVIGGWWGSDITNLYGLDMVTFIGGNLRIFSNDLLTNLTGLGNLNSIGGDLSIGDYEFSGNQSLTSLTGLSNLTSIGGGLNLWQNYALTSLSGLDNVAFIGGDLNIARNTVLTSLTGLENISSVPGNLTIGTYYHGYPMGNPSLASLTGLDNITSIGGNLSIVDNDSLINLTGLNNIDAESIDNLIITFNNSLSTCEVQSICDYLASPNGTITFFNNAPGCNSQQEVEEACDARIQINIDVLLEGPFNETEMETNLNLLGLIPNEQPYGSNPWYYGGTENVLSIPNNDIVDWILVEFRDAPGDASTATSATTFEYQAAFLLKDGTIVGVDGYTDLILNNQVSNNLYAVIHHRNHILIMSSGPIPLSGNLYEYDFTGSETTVYGGATGYVEIAPGIWGMVSGDGLCDGVINMDDKIVVWEIEAGISGYQSGDFIMNGNVDNKDKNDNWKPNIGKNVNIPN